VTPILAQRARSDKAFERLYQRHVGDVYRYALVVLRNEADAEDVTQTTFMNAYRAFKGGEQPRAPQNWLIAIAHNVCRQRFRQAARRPNEVAFEEELAESVAPDDDAPSAQDIRRALDHLAFNQRAALVMRELEGRSYTEIAEILGLSVSAIETLIFRARRALREQLEGGLTCHEAELAVSKQLDGRLARNEKGALRAHLRECEDCARFARSQRAQRTAIRSLAAIPLPSSLASFFGGGGTTVAAGSGILGAGVVAKAVTAIALTAVAGGVGYEGVKHAPWRSHARHHSVAAAATERERFVTQATRPLIEHAVPLPGPGPNEPSGVLPKPSHSPRVTVQPQVPPAADVTPGLALGHDKVHGKSSIRPEHTPPVDKLKYPGFPKVHPVKPPPPPKAHPAKANPHAVKPVPPPPPVPDPGHGGGKK
jgi:RNA polymerase sigma-70 factor (ECF subfamily)